MWNYTLHRLDNMNSLVQVIAQSKDIENKFDKGKTVSIYDHCLLPSYTDVDEYLMTT